MTPDFELFSRLREAGITLVAEDGQLRVLAPAGALTPALREELIRQKQGILTLLKNAGANGGSRIPPVLQAKRADHLPLSFAQERLWFLYQMEPNAAYNIPYGVRLTGPLNVQVLEQCLNEIVRRHEALRTRFETVEWQPVQVVQKAEPLKIILTDLAAMGRTEAEAQAMKLGLEEARRPFDFKESTMMKVRLFRLAVAEHFLLLNLNHIASDGWSLGVLFSELEALYGAFVEGRPSPLKELPVQYADFAVWQRQWLQGEVLDKQLGYWKKQLEGAPKILELPTDRPRPAVQSYRGAIVCEKLPGPLMEKLQELSRDQGTTLFMTLMSAFQVLLHHYSGSEDILVGTPIAGRHYAEIEGLIGFFVNTLVMRGNLSGDPSFQTLLGRTRDTALEAYAHQDFPFERLVEELHPQRDVAHTPIFQVLFALQNMAGEELKLPGLEAVPVTLDSGTAKFDLSLFMREREGWLETIVEYNTDLFDEQTIKRMLGHYQTLLEGIVAHPEEKISWLPLLTEGEKRQILVEWNRTDVDYPKDLCLHELVQKQAERTPDAIAAVFEGKTLTYRELNSRANQLARHLQALGVGPDSLVGICVERSLEMVVGVLAILKAGGAYVPLEPEYPKERLAFMLEDSGVAILLTQAHLVAALPACNARLIRLDADWPAIAEVSSANVENTASPHHLAYVIYTSGSTGKPKGVSLSHQAAVHSTWARLIYYEQPVDSFLLLSSHAFDSSVAGIFWTLCQGGKLILPAPGEERDPIGIIKLISQHKISHLLCLPVLYDLMMSGENHLIEYHSLQVVIVAGEACPTGLPLKHRQKVPQAKLYNEYGPTECAVWSTVCQIDQPNQQFARNGLPIGRPIANAQCYILDKHSKPVPIGITGELCIGGPGLARGYYKRPELTAEKFVANPFSTNPHSQLYKTGDLARYLPDGNIEYVGRVDHQVKVRGFRIELGEIEEVLNRHSGVLNNVVVVREDTPGDKRLVSYLVSRNGPITSSELREFLRSKLPDYMMPAAFVTLPTLPLNPNGKVDRKALPKPEFEPADKSAPPATLAEIILARIWREVLGLKQVSVHDNFFESGGHSLLAVQLIGRINKSFNLNLPIPVFFQNPTIRGLAAALDWENHGKREPKLIQLQPGRSEGTLFLLDISIGLCRLAQNLEGTSPAIYGTVVPLSRKTFEAASDNEPDKLPTLQELAAAHTALIQSQVPSGPCLLAGHSFGGMLTFEVAHQLQQMGRKVEMIFLLDSWATRPVWWKKFKILTPARIRQSISFRASYLWSTARNKVLRMLRQPTSASPPGAGAVADLYKINHPIGDVPWEIWEKIYRKARKHYKLVPVESRAVLFRAQHNADVSYLYPVHPNLGWDGLFKNGLRMMEIPGNHLSLLKDPQAVILADRIKECLKELSDSDRACVNSLPKRADKPVPSID